MSSRRRPKNSCKRQSPPLWSGGRGEWEGLRTIRRRWQQKKITRLRDFACVDPRDVESSVYTKDRIISITLDKSNFSQVFVAEILLLNQAFFKILVQSALIDFTTKSSVILCRQVWFGFIFSISYNSDEHSILLFVFIDLYHANADFGMQPCFSSILIDSSVIYMRIYDRLQPP